MNNHIATYEQRLNLSNATFSLIVHDDATVAIVYKIMQSTGTPLILKICERRNDFLRELYFLQYFANKLPVPRIINIIEPEGNLHGAILMECLPGTVLQKSDFSHKVAYEIGSLLARIHNNQTQGYGDLTQQQDLSPDPRIHFLSKFEEGLAECEQHLPARLIEQCRLYFATHLNLLTSVDGPCIIHRDFRAGNIMIHDKKIQGIIDWSAACAGFAEEDFCPLEHGGWPSDQNAQTSFLAGYTSIRPLPDYSAIMPLLRINRALATLGFTLKRHTWNTTAGSLYRFNRTFLETFFHLHLKKS